MSTQTIFIDRIAPIIQRYCAIYGYKYPSAIIAQACNESAFGASLLSAKYHNYFGIKWYRGCGRSAVNMSTKEEYQPNILTSVNAGFMVGTSMEDGVSMYFEFLKRNSRYKNLKSATSSLNYVELLKADGYATSSSYVNNVYSIVPKYNLLRFDAVQAPKVVQYAGVVTASALNVRTAPSQSAEILQVGGHNFVLPNGICIAIEAESGEWGKIASLSGWVSLKYVQH